MKTTPILFLSLMLAACEDGITTDAQPIVSVLKQDGGCFALMAGAQLEPTLGVAGTCPYRGTTQLTAGVDLIEVVVDYGPDVPFSGTTMAPPPNVVVTVDGVDVQEPVTLSDEFRVGERAYYIATFRAPKGTASTDVRISASVNAGFQTLVPEVLTISKPKVELVLLECETGPCDVPGATGSVHVHLAVAGTVTQNVTIHSTLDGIPQPDPVPPIRTFAINNRTENTSAIPTPAAPDGTLWTISAQIEDGPLTEADAHIRAPEITTELTCGTACGLSDGNPVGLEIVTAAGIRPLEALVTTRLNGIPSLVDVKVPLTKLADGTAHGTLGMIAPGPSGTWQIDVTIAGYSADTIVTQVQ